MNYKDQSAKPKRKGNSERESSSGKKRGTIIIEII